jgi:hypothetical protein
MLTTLLIHSFNCFGEDKSSASRSLNGNRIVVLVDLNPPTNPAPKERNALQPWFHITTITSDILPKCLMVVLPVMASVDLLKVSRRSVDSLSLSIRSL